MQILIDFFVSYIFIYLPYYSNNKDFYLFLDMNIGSIISQLRDKNSFSQSDLAEKSNVSRVMIGKYERGEAIPSIDAAKKIADALGVSLDFLVGESNNASFDKRTLQRIKDLELLEESKKDTLFDLIDTYIRDFKTRGAYSSI
jgi:transcriptional regulator with XRE-family HTH domain